MKLAFADMYVIVCVAVYAFKVAKVKAQLRLRLIPGHGLDDDLLGTSEILIAVANFLKARFFFHLLMFVCTYVCMYVCT